MADPDISALVKRQVEALLRSPDPRFQQDRSAAGEALRASAAFARLGLPDEFFTMAPDLLDAETRDAWNLAREIASSYVESIGRPELAPPLSAAQLAVSRADRWTTSCTSAGAGSYVVSIDSGLQGALGRVGRYLALYWQWDSSHP